MARHIGIAACSAEGAALCYRTICTEGPGLLGAHAHPEVSMHTPSLADYVACLERDDWSGVAELMLASAHKLARIGAEFVVCPDNTIHQALPLVAPRSPLPWLHIAEVVAAEAAARGFRRLAITGTRWLVASDTYPDKLTARGLEFARPTATERDEISRIIMDELVYGVIKPDAIVYLQRVIARLRDDGCDAVILGCTELPLVLGDTNSPLPTLDSTRLLARAALRHAIA
jgi:aspartate racemase